MLTLEGMRQFTGTEEWYRHPLNRNIFYTEGARYVAEEGGAYWLLDEIAMANHYEKKVKAEEFQVWKLTKNATGNGAILQCEDGNDNVVFTKRIEFTDFPLESIELWCEDGNGVKVILLPSEH